jgi:hypothetical protein
MKQLAEMNPKELTYLKQKWSAETTELDREITRAQEKLESRIQRQELDQDELDEMQLDLNNAESLLTHLQSTGAPAGMIANQQVVVNKLQALVDTETKGANVLTDEEAYLQQARIDQLRLQKQYRLDKIVEIDALLAA